MSEMVDRVAKVLFAAQNGGYSPMTAIKWDGLSERGLALWRYSARQAIEEMREPTDEMIEEAHIIIGGLDDQRRSWQAAIDAALKQHQPALSHASARPPCAAGPVTEPDASLDDARRHDETCTTY